jgi:hypothetical protein
VAARDARQPVSELQLGLRRNETLTMYDDSQTYNDNDSKRATIDAFGYDINQRNIVLTTIIGDTHGPISTTLQELKLFGWWVVRKFYFSILVVL